MNYQKVLFIIAISLLVLSGCKKDDPAPAATPTGACNSLSFGGAFVPETAGTGTMGTGAGGTIVDGTYNLTTWSIYPPGSVDPYMRKQTIKITGTAIEFLSVRDNEAEQRASGTLTVSGNDIVILFTCPSTQGASAKYTATATELRMYEISSGTNEIHVFTKQ